MNNSFSRPQSPSLNQRNGKSIFTFHIEDGALETWHWHYDRLAKALKKANPSRLAKETGITAKLGYEFQEVADCLMAVLRVEVDPPRGFIPKSPIVTTDNTQLEGIAIETWKLVNTHTIKFRQKYQDIPVYGALVTVEVDENNELLAINSAIGDPIKICNGVDGHPKIKSDQIKDLIEEQTKRDLTKSDLKPTLYYYFDSTDSENKKHTPEDGCWRLVYLVENQLKDTSIPFQFESIPEMVDYVIDAHTGKLVSELPRVKTIQ